MDSEVVVEKVSKSFALKQNDGILDLLKSVRNPENKNGKLKALDQVSFTASKGEMIGIIGRNGSGKTTLLRTIAGIYNPDSGKISVKGRIAPLLHIGTGFNDELNAEENIIISGMLMGMSKKEMKKRVQDTVEFAELEKFSEMKIKHYSSGMKARLAFSSAIQVNPDVLLVDEILSVGDEAFRDKSFKEFMKFKKNKKTIIYATHNLARLKFLCNRVLLIDHGKIIMEGEPVEVIKKYRELINQENQ